MDDLIAALERNGGPLATRAAQALHTIRQDCAAEARRIKATGRVHHSQWRNGWNEACEDIATRILEGGDPDT